jgi:hypothetical protein
MKTEFCHVCGEEITDLFWLCCVEEIGKHFQRTCVIKKICLDPDCFGVLRFDMMLENDSMRLRALGSNESAHFIENKAWT